VARTAVPLRGGQEKQMKWIAMFFSIFVGSCLAGCGTHGNRSWSFEVLGSRIAFNDHTENDETGKPNYSVDFTDYGKKTVDALFWWAKPKPEPVELPPDPANENPAGELLSKWKQLKPEERAALLPMLSP